VRRLRAVHNHSFSRGSFPVRPVQGSYCVRDLARRQVLSRAGDKEGSLLRDLSGGGDLNATFNPLQRELDCAGTAGSNHGPALVVDATGPPLRIPSELLRAASASRR
jgi:hypothetical protein